MAVRTVAFGFLLGVVSCRSPENGKPHQPTPEDKPLECGGKTEDFSPTDELGRLLTAPGLCSITSVVQGPNDTETHLNITYDASGRPIEAKGQFGLGCDDFDPNYEQTCEYQILRWNWSSEGRLLSAGYNAELTNSDSWAEDEDYACMIQEPTNVEAMSWTYDELGRVIEADWQYMLDCNDITLGHETLTYSNGAVVTTEQVTEDDESKLESWHYELDACERVVATDLEGSSEPRRRFTYDETGRLIASTFLGESQEWDYTGGVVQDRKGKPWAVKNDPDQRVLRLTPSEGPRREVVVSFDEASRVISVETTQQSWTLAYDDCPNASHASTRWRVGDIFFAWPFVDPPFAGEGPRGLDYWLHAVLPLHPEAL